MSRPRQSGFTLIEIMVALTAGMIAISTVYYLTGASSRHFHEQQRLSQTQMGLRMAMAQIRSDLARAGFHGTPDSRADRTCRDSAIDIQAIELLEGDGTDELPEAALNEVVADTLRIVGNFATGDAYLITGVDALGQTIFFQQNWQAFRRDFGEVGTPAFAAAFEAAFRPGRVLHLVTLAGNHFFPRIASVNSVAGTVTLNGADAIGSGGTCVGGLADGATVAPLSRVEYRVINPRDDDRFSALAGVDAAADTLDDLRGMTPAILVRQEITFNDPPQPIAGTERVVLEYVAEIDYMFRYDQRESLTAPNLTVCGPGATTVINGDMMNDPAGIRSVQVRLHARAAGEDTRIGRLARPADSGDPCISRPLLTYDVNASANAPGVARVRSAVAEVALTNVIARNL